MANFISFQPSAHFNTKLYTGNYSTNAITGVGFQPDFTVLKQRDGADAWYNVDSVRGATETIYWDVDTAEETVASGLTSFDADGFTVGANNAVNQNTADQLAYSWKMGTTSGLTGGTITPTAYSINTTAGQSAIAFTGNGTSGATVPHGLGVAPQYLMLKDLDGTNAWNVQVPYKPTGYLSLDTTDAFSLSTNRWNDTAPTSTVFSLGDSAATNGSGNKYIIYCFAPKKGYSFSGWYEGNSDNDGPFQYCGFRPSMILLKASTGTDWYCWNSQALGYNPDNRYMYPNLTNSEGVSSIIDILSNGFKIRSSSSEFNGAGVNNYWIAFAEFPFVSSNSKAGVAR